MDEAVTDDQRAVLDATSQFISKHCAITHLRRRAHDTEEFRRTYWKQAAELGWFSMLVPEFLGGGSASENGVLDAALIANKLGSALQPGPFVGTNVVAFAVSAAGTDAQKEMLLADLISGEASAAWAVDCRSGGALEAGVWATPTDFGYELRGFKSLVQDTAWATTILVTASSPSGPRQFLLPIDAPGISIQTRRSLDLTRSFAQVAFDRVPARSSHLLTDAVPTADLMDRQLAIACTLTAAQSVGTTAADLDMTVQYAKDRTAFGRPIGSFQAVKHLLVDSSLSLELGKATVIAAAEALGSNDDTALQAASMAKAFVGDTSIDIVQNCTQVFGGIGLTWEHDQHLYVRRVTTDASLYGDAVWHRERLCQLAGV